jgi:hypothetical protein
VSSQSSDYLFGKMVSNFGFLQFFLKQKFFYLSCVLVRNSTGHESRELEDQ